MENTLKDCPGGLDISARLVENNMGEAEVLYDPDEATIEGLRTAVPMASGDRHNFTVISASEDS